MNKPEKVLVSNFLQSDDSKKIDEITSNANNTDKIITRIIGDLKTKGYDTEFFKMPTEQFQKINTLIEKLTMYNNLLSHTGMIKTVFVNNPEIMIGFTNNIIIYLISLLTSEVDTDHNTCLLYTSPSPRDRG